MNDQEIKALLEAEFQEAKITISGDGRHFDIQIVSSEFAGLKPLERQRKVYRVLGPHIASGAIHAVNLLLQS